MLKIYSLIGDIKCVEIVTSLTLSRKIVNMEGWIGAHIRNMLLAATNKIYCDESRSLMDMINRFPIEDETHPWHKELKGGFPKGYSIKVLSSTKRGYIQTFEQGESIRFSVVMIGSIAEYADKMIEAIELFAQNGLHGQMDCSIESVSNFSIKELFGSEHTENKLSIDFITPMSLFNNKKTPPTAESLRYRMNGFIPLYQLVTSAANRVAKMAVLYGSCCSTAEELAEATAEISNIACSIEMQRCNLNHTVLTTAKRRATKDTMVFDGLIGETVWRGDFVSLYPLLRFCSIISLGDNVVYGMGHFDVV